MKKLKAFVWTCQDRYDDFMAKPRNTHLLCAVAGALIGAYLAYMVRRCS